jgi:ABC-type transport system substrate-binding protein
MFLRGWTYDYGDPDTELNYYMHSGANIATKIHFNDSYVDNLIDEGRSLYNAGQEEKREVIYPKLQDYIVEKGYSVPLYPDGFFYAYRDYVKNYIPWKFTDACNEGLWNIEKEIPNDWKTHDPPF